MKNLHLLQIDTTSKLVKIYNDVNRETFTLKLDVEVNDSFKEYVNVYITSDEEIKEGDVVKIPCGVGKVKELIWKFGNDNPSYIVEDIFIYKLRYGQKEGELQINSFRYEDVKKIILTTDQDLIKDGVQAIDDEFLEWFVKNPSCEFVELKHIIKEYVDDQDAYGYDVNYYKIIIPKEDLKNPNNQEIMFHKERKEYFYEDIVDGEHKMVWLGKEEPKKDCFSLPNCTCKEYNLDVIKGLCKICGNSIIHLGERVCVKSKQEKSYSEEEVWKLVNKLNETLNIGSDLTLEEWFEQFKK